MNDINFEIRNFSKWNGLNKSLPILSRNGIQFLSDMLDVNSMSEMKFTPLKYHRKQLNMFN